MFNEPPPLAGEPPLVLILTRRSTASGTNRHLEHDRGHDEGSGRASAQSNMRNAAVGAQPLGVPESREGERDEHADHHGEAHAARPARARARPGIPGARSAGPPRPAPGAGTCDLLCEAELAVARRLELRQRLTAGPAVGELTRQPGGGQEAGEHALDHVD